ncbi:MAG: ABC transporter ATP-binding protein [Acidobacteriota bacterium]
MSQGSGLIVDDVSHVYDRTVAAQNVSLEVRPGEVHCLLGPSGSGKSTLLRVVAGLETLQSGRVEIAGREVAGPDTHLRPEQRSVGFVFQDYALFPHLNVHDNIAFGMPKTSRERKREQVGELLAKIDMAGFEATMPHTLSGGQQQRVALARALASHPAVMLLDEPFSGLDTQLRREVRHKTLELLHATQVATLMVTHDPQEALATADSISIIRGGRIVQTGSPEEVYLRSANRQIAEVFGRVNRLSRTVRKGLVAVPGSSVAVQALADGTAVEVLLRPESIELERHATAGAITAKIADISREGATLTVTLILEDGSRLEARDLARQDWKVGETVHLKVAPEAAMIQSLPSAE